VPSTISFRLSDAERDQLTARAERENISLSDYIRVTLGLRGPSNGVKTATDHNGRNIGSDVDRLPQLRGSTPTQGCRRRRVLRLRRLLNRVATAATVRPTKMRRLAATASWNTTRRASGGPASQLRRR
jgi:hypothetical protein